MPASYEKLGLKFQYPDTWSIDEEEARGTRNAVTVYSPEGAFWSVNVQSADEVPLELARSAVEAMKAEYQEIDVEPLTTVVEDWELVGFELNFYCLDFTNTSQIQAVKTPFGTYVIMCQAEDRDFQRLEVVFRAITASLLRN